MAHHNAKNMVGMPKSRARPEASEPEIEKSTAAMRNEIAVMNKKKPSDVC